ncbi:hypothetical protein DBR43_25025 [Pedobacter sp. KBW06]|nr:hypothetical protein DBR43_25025 [Pedobacter sp. KBW06]
MVRNEFQSLINRRTRQGCWLGIKMIFCMVLFFCFMACSGQSGKRKTNKIRDQKELQKLWTQEKHRLEIDYCKLYYNGKQIMLHDSISNLKRIIGANYKDNDMGGLFYQDVPVFVMLRKRFKGGVSTAEAEATNASYTTVPVSIQIMMGGGKKEASEKTTTGSNSYAGSIPKAKYIKINGAIISSDMMPDKINELMESNRKPVFGARRTWAYAKVYSSTGNPRMEQCQPDPRLKQEDWTDIEIRYQTKPDDESEPSYMTSITYQYSNRYAEIKP